MDTAQIIEVVKATAGSLDSLISQFAWFLAIHAASGWLSFTLPLLIMFGIFLRVGSTLKVEGSDPRLVGGMVLLAWTFFALTLFTGVRGVSYVIQAAVSPSIYVASEVGGVAELLKSLPLKK